MTFTSRITLYVYIPIDFAFFLIMLFYIPYKTLLLYETGSYNKSMHTKYTFVLIWQP